MSYFSVACCVRVPIDPLRGPVFVEIRFCICVCTLNHSVCLQDHVVAITSVCAKYSIAIFRVSGGGLYSPSRLVVRCSCQPVCTLKAPPCHPAILFLSLLVKYTSGIRSLGLDKGANRRRQFFTIISLQQKQRRFRQNYHHRCQPPRHCPSLSGLLHLAPHEGDPLDAPCTSPSLRAY